ncbi:alpha/beta fold hydrolase [Nocardiopsis composta]|uniref:Pimeloyl-ACP methyl ester carboxylesterase n=1 Tax=Nocardiopsis composta TaxID=157465 RepID=A0A7W8VE31_9ACTN|nr:alpha/beta hydrolase [Nocardiopsis composta]MBB5432504.1 pimeloyl-ACP methyl ester carboxylesterase [Nocardiopsis composta]
MTLTSDTVVCASGLGGAAFDWEGVRRLLQDRYRVVRFDRRNLRPTLRSEAMRLAGLAEAAGGPVVVVAHSVAALHAEAFARLRPELVCGLVLVDPSCEVRTPSPSALRSLAWRVGGGLVSPFARAAGPALRRAVVRRQTVARRDPAPREAVRRHYGDGQILRAAAAELACYDAMVADLHALRRRAPFPPVGLVVLTAPDGPAWRGCHEGLAALSPCGRRIDVPRAAHLLHLEFPEVVAEAADDLAQGGRRTLLGGR